MTRRILLAVAVALTLAACQHTEPAGRIGDGLPETTEPAPPAVTPTP